MELTVNIINLNVLISLATAAKMACIFTWLWYNVDSMFNIPRVAGRKICTTGTFKIFVIKGKPVCVYNE